MRPEKKEALTRFHREQILTAAEALFTEKGAAGTTMDDIANRADYSKATLYVYFKNKEEIVNAFILRGMEMLRERIAAAIAPKKDWKAAFYAVCTAAADFYFERPAAYEAAAGEISIELENPETPAVFREIFETGEALNRDLAEFLRRGAQAGAIVEQADPLRTVFILWSALSGIVRMAMVKEAYLHRQLSLTRKAFLQESFSLLLRSLQEGGGEA